MGGDICFRGFIYGKYLAKYNESIVTNNFQFR